MLLVIAVVVAAAQLALAPLRPGSTASIDRANMYLGVIVPAARDEATTLSRLGLPARCAQMTGTNGWSPGTGRIEGACPDVAELSAFQFLALVPAEPLTLARAVSRVLPAAEAIVPGYLAISPDGAVATVYDLPPQTMSFVALLLGVPSIVFAAAMVVLLLAFPGFLLWMLWSVRSEPEGSALPTVFVMLVAIGGYTLATTALGTGLPGAERNNWLGALATLAGILLLPAAMWQLTTDLLRARIALAAAFGVCLLAIGWILWSQSQPLAIGALEKLSEATGHKLEIGGFALDPWGVRRVYATVGGGPQTDGVRGIERRDVALVYPGYPDASGGGFQITIPPNKWREAQQLKIYVESRTGALTEIDRRPIRLAP
jgi:hypothetical protein